MKMKAQGVQGKETIAIKSYILHNRSHIAAPNCAKGTGGKSTIAWSSTQRQVWDSQILRWCLERTIGTELVGQTHVGWTEIHWLGENQADEPWHPLATSTTRRSHSIEHCYKHQHTHTSMKHCLVLYASNHQRRILSGATIRHL
jgi:hypothetical protein